MNGGASGGTPRGGRRLGAGWQVALFAMFAAGVAVAASSGLGLVWYVPYAGVGTILVMRRPGTSIGWILLALGWGMAATLSTVEATPAQFAGGSLGPVTSAWAVVQAVSGLVLFYLLALLAIVFPSGHLPVGSWGAVTRIGLAVGAGMLIAALLMPAISVSLSGTSAGVGVRNPLAILPDLAIWSVITPDTVVIPSVVLLAGSVTSLFVRYVRAAGLERQQLRWITAALGLLIAGVLTGFVVSGIVPGAADSGAAWIGPIVTIPLVPLAIGIAVLRYRLYEIDRIISRSISWALTTGLIGALFAGLIVALQALLAPVTSESSLAVAASTLAAAAMFQPLRARVQAAVDRRFNRSRYDAEVALAALAARLRVETDLTRVGREVEDAVRSALAPSRLAVWTRR